MSQAGVLSYLLDTNDIHMNLFNVLKPWRKHLLALGASYNALDTLMDGGLEGVAMKGLDPILDIIVYVPKRAVATHFDPVVRVEWNFN